MRRRALFTTSATAGFVVVTGIPAKAEAAHHTDDLCFLPPHVLARMLSRGKVSAVEITNAHLARIARRQPVIRAYATTRQDLALADARRSDERRRIARRGGKPLHPLDGLPAASKMLFDFVGGPGEQSWDFGSLAFQGLGFVPPASAPWVEALQKAGMVFLGVTDSPEFGHKSTTGNRIRGAVRSPWDHRHNPGGSSGGAGAAAADHQGVAFIGSDAAGSIRTPSALSGVVGHYPSRGLIAQPPAPLAARPFFSPGPIARDVWTVAHQLGVMSAPNAGDPLGLPPLPSEWRDYAGVIEKARRDKPLKGMRIAYSASFDGIFPVEPAVAAVVRAALQVLESAGAIVEEVPLGFDKLMLDDPFGGNPRTATRQDLSDLWVHNRQAVLYAHAADLLRHYGLPVDLRQVTDKLSPQFAAMLQDGIRLSALDHLHGDFLAAAIDGTFQAAFAKYDCIVTPTTGVARVLNNNSGNTLGPTTVNGVAVDSQIGWTLTHLVNSSGVPATSVPCGFVSNPDGGRKLPVGMQVIGQRFRDDRNLLVAASVEARQPWAQHYPQEH